MEIDKFIDEHKEDLNLVVNDYNTRAKYYESLGLYNSNNLGEDLKVLLNYKKTDNTAKNLSERIEEFKKSLALVESLKSDEDYYNYSLSEKIDPNLRKTVERRADYYIVKLMEDFNAKSTFIKLNYINKKVIFEDSEELRLLNLKLVNYLLTNEVLSSLESYNSILGKNYYAYLAKANAVSREELESKIDAYESVKNLSTLDKKGIKEHNKKLKKDEVYAQNYQDELDESLYSAMEDILVLEHIKVLLKNYSAKEFNSLYNKDLSNLGNVLQKLSIL